MTIVLRRKQFYNMGSMHRLVAILLTGWVLLGAPLLCMGGILEHDCACKDCCEPGPDTCTNCTQHPCSPGHTCEGDPCDSDVIRGRSTQSADDFNPLAQIHAAITPLIERPALLAVDASIFTERGIRPRLPSSFAERGLPLLN